ncbi:MAG: M56 family metallopeptidase [Erythrobacter sp.]
MSVFLLDTLVWTGVLIALVLVLRRPVARMFGAQVAYALWLLPALRLVLPPIELPARFRPISPSGAPDVVSAPELAPTLASAAMSSPVSGGPALAPDPAMFLDAALAVWLGGAAVFLVMRFNAYFQLRAELLRDASGVGCANGVRLIETPGTNTPLAFGVTDKIVALPPGFMARPDREGRDLALAHELAHHSGRDLLANMLVQPLFALHWFNPLGWWGWLALRRDQEAACDARVMARCARENRAAYARLITSFAAGPRAALAAPMACPVLGEKSIIHRLRSLSMNDVSPTRRIAARALMAAGVLALPLTGTVSYAKGEASSGPDTFSEIAPLADQAAAPEPQPSGRQDERRADRDAERDVNVAVRDRLSDEELAAVLEEAERGLAEARRALTGAPDAAGRVREQAEEARASAVARRERNLEHTEEIREGMLKHAEELREGMRERVEAEAERQMERAQEAREQQARARERMLEQVQEARERLRDGGTTGAHGTIMIHECSKDGEATSLHIGADGQRVIAICKSELTADALSSLLKTRRSVFESREIREEQRARALEMLEEGLRQLKRDRS